MNAQNPNDEEMALGILCLFLPPSGGSSCLDSLGKSALASRLCQRSPRPAVPGRFGGNCSLIATCCRSFQKKNISPGAISARWDLGRENAESA